MRQAIVTRFIGPTDRHPNNRIIARADAGSVTVVCDDSLDIEDNHTRAACALAAKFGWLTVTDANHVWQDIVYFREQWVGGGLPQKGTKWAYCFVQREG